VTDLPDLMIMRWTGAGATVPLTIYGPEGTQGMVEGFRAALAPDIRYRFAHHGDKLSKEGIECIVHEVPATPDVAHVANVGSIAVSSFEVDHWPVKPAFGFHVASGGASIVLSGDTKRCDSLVRAAKNADILVSEAMHIGMMKDRIAMLRKAGNERVAAMLDEACDYHVSILDAAEMAQQAGVKHLVVSHLLPPIPDEGPLVDTFIAGASDVFKGKLTVGRDLQRFTAG
jgi:ribonuclease Z